MKLKIFFFLIILLKINASHLENSKFDPIYNQLSIQRIFCDIENLEGKYKIFNIDGLGAYMQGTHASVQTLVKGLKPFNIFKNGISLKSITQEHFQRLQQLPLFPSEIKRGDHFLLYIFVYAAEAFNKENDPFFIYVLRPLEKSEIIPPLTNEDFNFEEQLSDYKVTCSLLPLINNIIKIEDPLEKSELIKQIADIGIIEIQHYYAFILYQGQGIEQNLTEAFKYFELAADQGHKEAQFNCGMMLYYEEGIKQNLSKAFKYFKLAADEGHREAQYYSAVMLTLGHGIEKNLTEAFKYFKLAADLGHADAGYNCGCMLEKGKGIDKNLSEALIYYKLAADQGHKEAEKKHDDICLLKAHEVQK
ncbi:MAG: sel1 repeat family protein [Proteobacteria bacterium]|nr:sel1 repeat family protein [Pseudomonadota bacterium]